MKEWTNQDLQEYVNSGNFSENQRDNVLKEILEDGLIEKFLGTTEGRLILDKTVDLITSDTMLIVRLAVKGGSESEITHAALRINTAFNFMHGLAEIAVKGGEHIKRMKKK